MTAAITIILGILAFAVAAFLAVVIAAGNELLTGDRDD